MRESGLPASLSFGRNRMKRIRGDALDDVRGLRAAGADGVLGLPYARPPIKARRFRPPVAAAGWSRTRDATRQASACTQFEPTGVRENQATSEDCLYLDLYRPSTAKRGAKLPVVVWLHGGGYTQGSGVIY